MTRTPPFDSTEQDGIERVADDRADRVSPGRLRAAAARKSPDSDTTIEWRQGEGTELHLDGDRRYELGATVEFVNVRVVGHGATVVPPAADEPAFRYYAHGYGGLEDVNIETRADASGAKIVVDPRDLDLANPRAFGAVATTNVDRPKLGDVSVVNPDGFADESFNDAVGVKILETGQALAFDRFGTIRTGGLRRPYILRSKGDPDAGGYANDNLIECVSYFDEDAALHEAMQDSNGCDENVVRGSFQPARSPAAGPGRVRGVEFRTDSSGGNTTVRDTRIEAKLWDIEKFNNAPVLCDGAGVEANVVIKGRRPGVNKQVIEETNGAADNSVARRDVPSVTDDTAAAVAMGVGADRWAWDVSDNNTAVTDFTTTVVNPSPKSFYRQVVYRTNVGGDDVTDAMRPRIGNPASGTISTQGTGVPEVILVDTSSQAGTVELEPGDEVRGTMKRVVDVSPGSGNQVTVEDAGGATVATVADGGAVEVAYANDWYTA